MKLRRSITIKGYIESDTENTPSLLSAAAAVRNLTSPGREFAEVQEAPEVQDMDLASAYRSLVDLEVKVGAAKAVRTKKAETPV